MLAVNGLHWTVTHFRSACVVDNLQGKYSTSMAPGVQSVCRAYRLYMPGNSTSGLHEIGSASGP